MQRKPVICKGNVIVSVSLDNAPLRLNSQHFLDTVKLKVLLLYCDYYVCLKKHKKKIIMHLLPTETVTMSGV